MDSKKLEETLKKVEHHVQDSKVILKREQRVQALTQANYKRNVIAERLRRYLNERDLVKAEFETIQLLEQEIEEKKKNASKIEEDHQKVLNDIKRKEEMLAKAKSRNESRAKERDEFVKASSKKEGNHLQVSASSKKPLQDTNKTIDKNSEKSVGVSLGIQQVDQSITNGQDHLGDLHFDFQFQSDDDGDDLDEKIAKTVEKLRAANAEVARIEAERDEQQRIEEDDGQSLEAERVEIERIEAEKIEDQKREAERAEQLRTASEKEEQQRVEGEKLTSQRIEIEKVGKIAKIKLHRLEAERSRQEEEPKAKKSKAVKETVIEKQKSKDLAHEKASNREFNFDDGDSNTLLKVPSLTKSPSHTGPPIFTSDEKEDHATSNLENNPSTSGKSGLASKASQLTSIQKDDRTEVDLSHRDDMIFSLPTQPVAKGKTNQPAKPKVTSKKDSDVDWKPPPIERKKSKAVRKEARKPLPSRKVVLVDESSMEDIYLSLVKDDEKLSREWSR